MTEKKEKLNSQLYTLNLTVVALVALVAIVSLVAILHPGTPSASSTSLDANRAGLSVIFPPVPGGSYEGSLQLDGVHYNLLLDLDEQVLLINGPEEIKIELQRGRQGLRGVWKRDDQRILISVDPNGPSLTFVVPERYDVKLSPVGDCEPYYAVLDYDDDSQLTEKDGEFLLRVIAGGEKCPAHKLCDVNRDLQLTPADGTTYALIQHGEKSLGEICADKIDNDCDGRTDDRCITICVPYSPKWDYDDDGVLTQKDADYLLELVKNGDSCPKCRNAKCGYDCDPDGDGKLTEADAKYLLTYAKSDNPSEVVDGYDNNCNGEIDEKR